MLLFFVIVVPPISKAYFKKAIGKRQENNFYIFFSIIFFKLRGEIKRNISILRARKKKIAERYQCNSVYAVKNTQPAIFIQSSFWIG